MLFSRTVPKVYPYNATALRTCRVLAPLVLLLVPVALTRSGVLYWEITTERATVLSYLFLAGYQASRIVFPEHAASERVVYWDSSLPEELARSLGGILLAWFAFSIGNDPTSFEQIYLSYALHAAALLLLAYRRHVIFDGITRRVGVWKLFPSFLHYDDVHNLSAKPVYLLTEEDLASVQSEAMLKNVPKEEIIRRRGIKPVSHHLLINLYPSQETLKVIDVPEDLFNDGPALVPAIGELIEAAEHWARVPAGRSGGKPVYRPAPDDPVMTQKKPRE